MGNTPSFHWKVINLIAVVRMRSINCRVMQLVSAHALFARALAYRLADIQTLPFLSFCLTKHNSVLKVCILVYYVENWGFMFALIV